jgi:hypothetical protein
MFPSNTEFGLIPFFVNNLVVPGFVWKVCIVLLPPFHYNSFRAFKSFNIDLNTPINIDWSYDQKGHVLPEFCTKILKFFDIHHQIGVPLP